MIHQHHRTDVTPPDQQKPIDHISQHAQATNPRQRNADLEVDGAYLIVFQLTCCWCIRLTIKEDSLECV